MFKLVLNGVPCLFQKINDFKDVKIFDLLCEAGIPTPKFALFGDLAPTDYMVSHVEELLAGGCEVVYLDHHKPAGEPTTSRDAELLRSGAKLSDLLNTKSASIMLFTCREEAPACIELPTSGGLLRTKQSVGFFDADNDGFFTALCECGLVGEGNTSFAPGYLHAVMHSDAMIFDGPPGRHHLLSANGIILAKALSAVPPAGNTSEERQAAAEARKNVYSEFVQYFWHGKPEAKQFLEDLGQEYDRRLERTARIPITYRCSGVLAEADLTKTTETVDLGELSKRLFSHGLVVYGATIGNRGPIADLHGAQVCVQVNPRHQASVDVRRLLPKDTQSSPEIGVIHNVPFRIFLAPELYRKWVLEKI